MLMQEIVDKNHANMTNKLKIYKILGILGIFFSSCELIFKDSRFQYLSVPLIIVALFGIIRYSDQSTKRKTLLTFLLAIIILSAIIIFVRFN